MKINASLSKIGFIMVLFIPYFSQAQLGINSDNSAPSTNAMLDVKSTNKGVLFPRIGSSASIPGPTDGLLFYNTTAKKFNYYDGSAWQETFFGNQWNVNGSSISYSAGNVGIGTSAPTYKLQVVGNSYFNGKVGIGDDFPDYPLDVNGGAGIDYIGISTTPNTTYKLDVAGNSRISGNLNVNNDLIVYNDINAASLNTSGNAAIAGSMTVNNGKGVAYYANNSNNLKIFRFTTNNILPILGPHDVSAEFIIGFGGSFTTIPTVIVGDIDSMGGAPPEFYGPLYAVKLQIYGCNTNSCKAKVVNLSDSSIKYNCTWNMVVIGY